MRPSVEVFPLKHGVSCSASGSTQHRTPAPSDGCCAYLNDVPFPFQTHHARGSPANAGARPTFKRRMISRRAAALSYCQKQPSLKNKFMPGPPTNLSERSGLRCKTTTCSQSVDSFFVPPSSPVLLKRVQSDSRRTESERKPSKSHIISTVSYTHLTLPTIYSV